MNSRRRYPLHDVSSFRFYGFLAVAVLCMAALGCSDSSTDSGVNGNGNGNGNEEPGPNEVVMSGHSFTPATLSIEPGETVLWKNETSEVHTVTSGSDGQHDGQFDSGNISPGAEYSRQFNEPGTYNYYCIPHVGAGMTGTIIVGDGGSDNDNGGENGGGGNGEVTY